MKRFASNNLFLIHGLLFLFCCSKVIENMPELQYAFTQPLFQISCHAHYTLSLLVLNFPPSLSQIKNVELTTSTGGKDWTRPHRMAGQVAAEVADTKESSREASRGLRRYTDSPTLCSGTPSMCSETSSEATTPSKTSWTVSDKKFLR